MRSNAKTLCYDLMREFAVLTIWVGGWNLIDTATRQLVDVNDKAKYSLVSACILIIGILLFVKLWRASKRGDIYS